jgi:restriction system protein
LYLYFLKDNNLKEEIYVAIFTLIFLLFFQQVFLYFIRFKRNEAFRNSGITIVNKMNGQEFEEFVLLHFKSLGYKGHTTAVTGDYGADIILTKDNMKIVVQAKRWNKKVGIEAVQQIIGAKFYYKADRSIVVTNNYFTPNAKNLSEKSEVELWDRNKLLEIMKKSNGKDTAKKVRVYCEKCGAPMVLRHGKDNDFFGCSSYPKCTYTKSKYY